MLQSSASQNHKWGTYTGVLSGEHITATFLNTSHKVPGVKSLHTENLQLSKEYRITF